MDIGESSLFESLSEVSIAEPHGDEKYCKFVARLVFGVFFIVFFLIYCLCMFLLPFLYDKKSEANDDVFELKKDRNLIALHFTLMVVAIIFGVLLLLFKFNILHGIVLVVFFYFLDSIRCCIYDK